MTDVDFTLSELLVSNLARDFKDGELGFTGLATGATTALYATAIPLVAMELARRTHAPNLTVLLAGWVHNPVLSALDELPDAEFDERLRDLPCESQLLTYPGQFALKRGHISFGFGSGVQIDRVGNINSVCIGDHDRPKVRLVGPILLPEHFSMFGREYVMMPRHDKRTFVEKVDYVAGVGYPGGSEGRRELGLVSGGPELVITPKCIFDFDKVEGRMKVRSIHPNVSIDDLCQSTGFDLGDLDGIPQTATPSSEEVSIIRNEIDPRGILLGNRNVTP
jgi:glutaconate CoA-transferase subunit B